MPETVKPSYEKPIIDTDATASPQTPTARKTKEKKAEENIIPKTSEVTQGSIQAPAAIDQFFDRFDAEPEKPLTHFRILSQLDVNAYVEKKKTGGTELSYMSWSFAWQELKKLFPDARYNIHQFGENNLPYVYDDNTGYMVFTDMTIEGVTYTMWLPVTTIRKPPQTTLTVRKRALTVQSTALRR